MIRDFLIVGGGSAYAPGLVAALLKQTGRHRLRTIRLYDIAATRLRVVEKLCRRMAQAADGSLEIRATTDPTEAVDGIDALLNSSRPGGFECRLIDETLPLEFNIPGQETVGPGGFFFALRSVPAALELAGHVERLAPDAVWLNYTNPTNIVGQALCEQSNLDVIALCDQSDEDMRALADAMGHGAGASYSFQCAGLNHATWYSDVQIDGQPLDDCTVDAQPPDYFDEEHRRRFSICAQMARELEGRWPNSYLPYYVQPRTFVELAQNQGTRTNVILENLEDYYDHFRQQADRQTPRLQHYRGSAGFGDMAADAIAALSSKEPDSMVLNIPNCGINDEFDEDTIVEARVDISASGVERKRAPSIPRKFQDLMARLERYQRRTARAAVTGVDDHMIEALATNPLVDDTDLARQMLLRAVERYGERLPQFRDN